MNKMKCITIIITAILLQQMASGQNSPHYTMFMYNKLLYNPAYAGSREVTEVNCGYRNQWAGIKGAPVTFHLAIDGPVGSYMNDFRKVAIGASVNSEQAGVEHQSDAMVYYSYRVRFRKTVISMGLDAGLKLYSANYSQLSLAQQNDLQFSNDVKNALLPNFGAGVYWSGERFYAGLSVPNLLENYYDKSNNRLSDQKGKELRSYYLSGGYVLPVSDIIQLEPQALIRYAGDGHYHLPVNCDFNLSAIAYNRLLVGVTYRTDKSIEAIVHLQVNRSITIGYAYDYLVSALSAYARGTHEVVLSYDFIRDQTKYPTPRFIKAF